MAKKTEFNETSFLISGGGRIDETAPIVLQDYVPPICPEKNAVWITRSAPKKIRLSKTFGKTTYDVVGLFDGADPSLFQQFKRLILENS